MHRYAPVFKGCGAADHCNSKRKHTLPRQLVGILVFCPVCFTAYACSPAGIVSRPAVEVRCVFGVESGGGGGGVGCGEIDTAGGGVANAGNGQGAGRWSWTWTWN